VREEGQHRYYSLQSSPLEDIEDWLIPFLSADFDPSRVDPDDSDESAAFAAWSGVRVGERVGRVVAERSFRAREVLLGARSSVAQRIGRLGRR
jgi:ArsR family transcriptional regulator